MTDTYTLDTDGWYVYVVPMDIPGNVSEADFVKWNQDRFKREKEIEHLTKVVQKLYDEVEYWKKLAIGNFRRG